MTVVVVTPRGKVAKAIAKQLLPNPIAIVTARCCYQFFNVVDERHPGGLRVNDYEHH